MSTTTNYYTVNGNILAEEQAGGSGYRIYGSDAVGSVVTTYDSLGASQNSYRYTPYGATATSSTIAADPLFLWVGSLGYRKAGGTAFGYYIRSRHYMPSLAGWVSVDLTWPDQKPYQYAAANPFCRTDPSGTAFCNPNLPCGVPCDPPCVPDEAHCADTCKAYYQIDQSDSTLHTLYPKGTNAGYVACCFTQACPCAVDVTSYFGGDTSIIQKCVQVHEQTHINNKDQLCNQKCVYRPKYNNSATQAECQVQCLHDNCFDSTGKRIQSPACAKAVCSS